MRIDDIILRDDWPINLHDEVMKLQERLIASALEESCGSRTKAAELLHMKRSTFVERMKAVRRWREEYGEER